MSSKVFLFTEDELRTLSNPETKAIALSGDTWEEAARFMLSKTFCSLQGKLDAKKVMIGYEVYWLEPEEQATVLKSVPEDVGHAFQNMEFDQEFIDAFIAENRRFIRRMK